MTLNLDAVGNEAGPEAYAYTWEQLSLYALGIGAGLDELDYLIEQRGPKVFPTFAVIPAFPTIMKVLAPLGGNPATILHGGQSVRMLAPMPGSGTLHTTGRLAAVYDKKKFAQAIVRTHTTTDTGIGVFESEWSILYRGAGGFGGASAPPGQDNAPPDKPPDHSIEEPTHPSQALLYRLSGDHNPLHSDPAFAQSVGFDKPILHGLCTFGYVGRALVKALDPDDGEQLAAMSCQFRQPVWPGETIVTEIWRTEENELIFRAKTTERDGPVLTHGRAEVTKA